MTLEITTFDEDLLELSEFAERLEKFIEVEQNFVQGSLVLALNSRFGFGKTTFLNMWKNKLDCSDDQDKTLVISLNAWESDYFGDPLFAIISSLVDSLNGGSDSAKTLVDAAKTVGWFTTAIGGQIAKKFTGIDAIAAGEFAEKKTPSEASEILLADAFSIFQGRKQAMIHLQKSIKDFVADSGGRVLFLVDELDRCRPDYAISYLETIKHIFDVHGAVFILAADRHQLENSAKTAFGPDLDFEEYYRKFIHREVTLPPISDTGYKKIAEKYVSYYLERDGLRNCYMQTGSNQVNYIVTLIGALKLTPRQIQEMFRIIGHLFEVTEEDSGNLLWNLGVGSIAMASLKVGNPRVYRLLGSQQFDPQDALDLLKSLLGSVHADWWFRLFLSGGGLKMKQDETLMEVMKKVGLIYSKQTEDRARYELDQSIADWGHSPSSRFVHIYENIQLISKWK
jgi:hypothetical protein